MTFAFFYRASLGGPDERREQKFSTLVGDHFGMSPTNILLTLQDFFLSAPNSLIHISSILSLASRTQHGRQNGRKATPHLESFLHL
ncbi:hypothetical protein B9L19_17050 [Geobacillus thermocatenulatus]|uniref:Uncharacterized protein n=1 Tax=Geobacillus thermocatenulatus TaxID=33938 RepID=A0AA91TDH1_9BACL|nr:hypothetical protein B9L19_17050 [Geobacillus thermocatenulatus]